MLLSKQSKFMSANYHLVKKYCLQTTGTSEQNTYLRVKKMYKFKTALSYGLILGSYLRAS